ncbi:MAG: hypothetical protein A2Y15_05700 [Clostridiales bacterium GWF2_36_10]|nr:MAG: hypothetical protein A2Y15_05700 [Clostridiales bacterium GWF2_36_10]HAN21963.1 diacylglycerol kinase [Clostridiales bacterium]
MNDKLLLVVNPRSGRGRAKDYIIEIVSTLTQGGKTVTVYPTCNKAATISYVAENVIKYNTIVVCGGDGTLNEVLNGLILSGVKIPVGYIPLGSTNDFATSLDLPSDCITAAENILNGNIFQYDIGSMNDNYFSYIACAGAFAETSYTTNQNLKNKIGHSAYLLSSVKSLSTLRKITMEVNTPEFSVTGDYLFCSFSNSLNAGALLNFKGMDIKFDDGLFELLLVKMPRDLLEFSALIRDLLNANLKNKYIELFRTNECHIKIERGIGWSLDGEDGGITDDIYLKVHPKAIDIIRS